MRSAGILPSAGFFVLLRLIVMPLYGEEHARAQDDNLERKDDYGEQVYPIQIHHFEYFQAVTRHYRYDERYLKTDASTTSIQALMQCLFDAAPIGSFRLELVFMLQRDELLPSWKQYGRYLRFCCGTPQPVSQGFVVGKGDCPKTSGVCLSEKSGTI
ncbi:hypothetical protein [Agrobacterium genomosp. 13]|uniref:Secreted protein n=1 Tax=Agrobacterium genomosp. 13 str. CFBP 6927 TaxID=1183428 RepID=A0ABP2BE24_9HYPH|nr:hypothetical protein [Agrobacterium genomosp. 13]CUX20322.1 hypothetical protein AGR13a_Cc210075 [Agrobacterium genomosp. 13 str. CFBP 6927]